MSETIYLVSVNTTPERAKKVIGGVIENVKDRYNIIHAGNSERVKPLLLSLQPSPGLLWSPEQQDQIQAIARETIPGIKTHAIPTGLHLQVGAEGVISYLTERLDAIMQEKS